MHDFNNLRHLQVEFGEIQYLAKYNHIVRDIWIIFNAPFSDSSYNHSFVTYCWACLLSPLYNNSTLRNMKITHVPKLHFINGKQFLLVIVEIYTSWIGWL